MEKLFIRIAAVFGAIAVILGALSAHYLKSRLSGGDATIFETGLRYQFYHVFALLAVGILCERRKNSFLKWSGLLFICGIMLFCGSIYIITLLPQDAARKVSSVVYLAPVGGFCFVFAWLLMFFGVAKRNCDSKE